MQLINVLLVEDNQEKLQLLKPVFDDASVQIAHVISIIDAQKELIANDYDMLLLDIQIPNDKTSTIDQKGGLKLLEWLEVYAGCYIPPKIFGFTGFVDNDPSIAINFQSRGIPLLHTSQGNYDWLNTIKINIEYLRSSKKESSSSTSTFDVAIITAMGHNELKAVKDLDIDWESFNVDNDPTIFFKGVLKTGTRDINIVAAHTPRMGMAASSCLTTRMCMLFNPVFFIMTGIAAGIEGKADMGDIIVADPCWDWGNGKLTSNPDGALFKPAPHQIPLNVRVKGQLQHIRDEHLYLSKIENDWRGPKPEGKLKLILGPMASGAVVLEDEETVETIVSHHRQTCGVEMEAYGVMSAVMDSCESGIIPIVIKSVCDNANPEKNDDWQNYASYTSAAFTYQLIRNHLFE